MWPYFGNLPIWYIGQSDGNHPYLLGKKLLVRNFIVRRFNSCFIQMYKKIHLKKIVKVFNWVFAKVYFCPKGRFSKIQSQMWICWKSWETLHWLYDTITLSMYRSGWIYSVCHYIISFHCLAKVHRGCLLWIKHHFLMVFLRPLNNYKALTLLLWRAFLFTWV